MGEGATGEMAGLIGVDWRSANGLQSPHRASMALCGSCDARDGAPSGFFKDCPQNRLSVDSGLRVDALSGRQVKWQVTDVA